MGKGDGSAECFETMVPRSTQAAGRRKVFTRSLIEELSFTPVPGSSYHYVKLTSPDGQEERGFIHESASSQVQASSSPFDAFNAQRRSVRLFQHLTERAAAPGFFRDTYNEPDEPLFIDPEDVLNGEHQFNPDHLLHYDQLTGFLWRPDKDTPLSIPLRVQGYRDLGSDVIDVDKAFQHLKDHPDVLECEIVAAPFENADGVDARKLTLTALLPQNVWDEIWRSGERNLARSIIKGARHTSGIRKLEAAGSKFTAPPSVDPLDLAPFVR